MNELSPSHSMSRSRRRILGTIAWSPLLALMGPTVTAADTQSWVDELNEAVRSLTPAADQRSGVDQYLFRLAAAAAKVDGIPHGELTAVDWSDNAVSFGMIARGSSFVVIEWELAPGAFLPPHNHPNGSVCTVGVAGEAVLENYEPVKELPATDSEEKFLLRRMKRQILTRGGINTLGPVRDNIHTFRAGPDGARGIDITSLHGRSETFGFMSLQKTTREDHLEARWISPGGES